MTCPTQQQSSCLSMLPPRLPTLRERSPPIQIQILSDLHLEVGSQYKDFNIPVNAPYLVLAGDIGRLIAYEPLLKFLTRQSQNLKKKVFYVLGNYAFYRTSRESGLATASKLEKEPFRLYILDKTHSDINERVILLGSTLHSKITPQTREVVNSKIQDCRKIHHWTVDDHNAAHTDNVSWLHNQILTIRSLISGGKDQTIVVVTHHAPLGRGTSKPAEEGNNAWSTAFTTDLIGRANLPAFEGVDWWIFGRSHYGTQFRKGGLRVVSKSA